MLIPATTLLLSCSLFLNSVSACGHDLHLYRRQRTNTWQSAAQTIDPTAECAPYSYAPVQAVVSTLPFIFKITTRDILICVLSSDIPVEDLPSHLAHGQSITFSRSLSVYPIPPFLRSSSQRSAYTRHTNHPTCPSLHHPEPGLDPQALEVYSQLEHRIPNIAVKGTPTGDFNATTPTYPRSDPDCWWSFNKCTTPKLPGLVPDVSTCPQPNTFGFTLDDGPNCSHNAYYDLLRQTNQKASLFYVGSNVIDWPLEAQRGLADGHEICSHTWSHNYMTGLTNEQAFAELYFSKKIIKDVLGITVQCWRPPFGDTDDRIRFIAASLGMSTILWDNDVNDFRFATLGQATVNANYQNLLNGAARGAFNTHGTVVLSHELNAGTMNTSAAFLPKIQAAFKYVVPVAVCQNNSQPYLETDYTYPNFAEWAKGTRAKNIPDPTPSPPGTRLTLPASPSQGSSSYPVKDGNGSNLGANRKSLATSGYNIPSSTLIFFFLGLIIVPSLGLL
ncbi:hypothetical protein MJO28_007730 [Puccinia striiformis f. sp. tritici]|uniref:Uncharacterized protein n=1 Tax=Puccinia striiformis f. sp. tritici TaxID=168172 RepID=A0ACC0EF87_9BASI|nr:hypothetical protein MJO28_007730 [Puccinia striiformis f. sp. tritici]